MSKLSRDDHLRMAAGLRVAKKYLATTSSEADFKGVPRFVCHAITEAFSKEKMSVETRNDLHNWIENQIYGARSVIIWLSGRDIEIYNNLIRTSNGVHLYRHAWVDHMIKVLES